MRGIAMAIIWLAFTIDMRFDRRWQSLKEEEKVNVQRFVYGWLLATILVIVTGL